MENNETPEDRPVTPAEPSPSSGHAEIGTAPKFASKAISRRSSLRRMFRMGIAGGSALAVGGLIAAFARTAKGRLAVDSLARWMYPEQSVVAHDRLLHDFERIDAWLEAELDARQADAQALVAHRYQSANAAQKQVLDYCGLAPGSAVYGRGLNVTNVGVLPGAIFESAPAGLAYRFRTKAVGEWYTIQNPFSGVGPSVSFFSYLSGAAPVFPVGLTQFANATGVAFDDYRLVRRPHHANSWGLRGAEPNPEAEVRVAFVGDSFVHGLCVADGDDPASQLEHRLSTLLKKKVSVVNAAGTGWGPKDYRAIVADLFVERRFAPQIVVIAVCELNDFGPRDALNVREMQPIARDRDLFLHSQYHLARCIDECVERGAVPILTFAPDIELFWTPRRHRVSAVLETLQAAKHGFRRADEADFVCDPIPTFVAERNRQAAEIGSLVARKWKGVPEEVQRRLKPMHLDEYQATVNGDGRFTDMHTNAFGNQIWARVLADHIAPFFADHADRRAFLRDI